jgi:hypothetical protein
MNVVEDPIGSIDAGEALAAAGGVMVLLRHE